MKYFFLCLSCFASLGLFSQSSEEQAIKKQLALFQKAHNNRNIDSMMMVVSSNYEETFLPDITYNARSLKNYYNDLINNSAYRSIIDYEIQDLKASGDKGTSDVIWDYTILPSRGSDTLYYARNKGMIQWKKEGKQWKMRKTFAGNLKEVNRLNDYSSDKAIQNELLDWISYYNSKDLEGVMSLYDSKVKGLSAFNGAYILYNDLKREYESIFNSDRINVSYELDGVEELKFSDDLAYSITVWQYEVYDSKTEISNKSKYRHLSIWEQQANGHWKIVSFVRKKIEE
jgi:ketosteroid isomerase-like protein